MPESVSEQEAHGLWKLTEAVANYLGTRPVQEIRVTAMTAIAVYERGTRKQRAQDHATRVLILGTALFDGLRTQAFRADIVESRTPIAPISSARRIPTTAAYGNSRERPIGAGGEPQLRCGTT